MLRRVTLSRKWRMMSGRGIRPEIKAGKRLGKVFDNVFPERYPIPRTEPARIIGGGEFTQPGGQ